MRLLDVLRETDEMYAGAPAIVKVYGDQTFFTRLLAIETVLPAPLESMYAAAFNGSVLEMHCAEAVMQDDVEEFATGCTSIALVTQA